MCDKLPFLDELVRFKVADSIECSHCKHKDIKEDTVVEFSISSDKQNKPLIECIAETVQENIIEDWKCDKCNERVQKTTTHRLISQSYGVPHDSHRRLG
jgi:uncharacterized UBP type Zn finger protein